MITPDSLNHYCDQLSSPELDILQKLRTETPKTFPGAHMMCGVQVGGVLQLLIKLMRPKLVVDVGTYTGYSAICIAHALEDDAKVITIEHSPPTHEFANKFFKQVPFVNRIDSRLGKAADILEGIDENIDLVFLDADKASYLDYLSICLSKMKSGSVIVADDVLWHGEVVDCEKNTRAKRVHDYNLAVAQDKRVEQVVLPIRHGLNILTVA